MSEGGVAALRTSIRLRSLAENHLKHAYEVKSSKTDEPAESDVPKCSIHDGEKLHFYCLTCKVLVCQVCLCLDHDVSAHKIKGAKTIYAERVENAEKKSKYAENEIKEFEKMVKHLLQLEKQVEESAASTEQQIDDAINKAQQNGEVLKAKLKELTQKELGKCQTQRGKLNNEMQVLQNMADDIDQVLQNSTPYDGMTKIDQLEEHIKTIDLKSNNQKLRIQSVPKTVTTYKMATELHELGRLVSVSNPVCMLHSTVEEVEQIHSTKIDDSISHYRCLNIAGTNNAIAICFVDRFMKGRVQIYHKEATCKYKCELTFDVADAVDVAVTPDGRILVAKNASVEEFSLNGQYKRTFCHEKGSHGDGGPIAAITVLSDGRVIILRKREGYLAEKFIIYTHDGRKLTTATLVHKISRLTAIKGSLVAWYSKLNQKVYVWDADLGKKLHCVHIPHPKCVCYDEMTDCLIIGTDDGNHSKGKIQQYHVSTKTFLPTIETGVPGSPVAMTFAGSNNLVVIIKGTTQCTCVCVKLKEPQLGLLHDH